MTAAGFAHVSFKVGEGERRVKVGGGGGGEVGKFVQVTVLSRFLLLR